MLLAGPGSAWERVIDTDSKKEVFERIDPMQAMLAKNHVLLYGHGKVRDEEVLELKRKADSWDSVTNLVPNFTHRMLLIADLVYKTDLLLVETLNLILEQNGVARVEHILHAIHRLGDTFKTEKERHLSGMALRKCFMEASNANVETTATAIQHQWPTCWKWTKLG